VRDGEQISEIASRKHMVIYQYGAGKLLCVICILSTYYG